MTHETKGKHRWKQYKKKPEVVFKLRLRVLPSQNSHGLPVILTAQQFVHICIQHSQGQLEYYFDSFIEETVDNHNGTLKGHHTEKQGEEPGQGDGGNHAQVLHAVIQLRDTISC